MPLRNLVIVGLLAGGTGLALAQTAPQPVPPPPATAPAPNPAPSGGTVNSTPVGGVFVAPAATEMTWRGSELAGRSVYNLQDETVGKVDELLIDDEGKVAALVIGVGGVLGLGRKDVAVAFRAFRLTRGENGEARLMLDIAKATLESAPDYVPVKARNPS